MLSLRDIYFSYHDQVSLKPVIKGFSLDVQEGEILCLLGPSGSGKSSLLRIISGLEKEYQGQILFDGEDIRPVPVYERGIGFMFQDLALFPHLSVYQNIEFGLKILGMPSQERQKAVTELLDLVGLPLYGKRDISQLSGGERQRVALARSLAPSPRLLLLDEPLAALDASLKEHLVLELAQIIKAQNLTAIYVTHDQQEAFAIADRIAIINDGQLQQLDPPEKIYHHPTNPFVARFLGFDNLFPIDSPLGQKLLTETPDTENCLFIHPDAIHLSNSPTDFEATIEQSIFKGSFYELTVRLMGVFLQFRVAAHEFITTQDRVHLIFDQRQIYLYACE